MAAWSPLAARDLAEARGAHKPVVSVLKCALECWLNVHMIFADRVADVSGGVAGNLADQINELIKWFCAGAPPRVSDDNH